MQGLMAIVLLLCCVNVAGLMMAKVYSRRQDFALRTAIGAVFDPLRIAAITGVLALVATAAGLVPALRAASIDPIRALRGDNGPSALVLMRSAWYSGP